MIFRTENSTYEVDLSLMLVRRIKGVNTSTPYQGQDGEWTLLESISPIQIGKVVWFIWGINSRKGATETTHTSPVVEIVGEV